MYVASHPSTHLHSPNNAIQQVPFCLFGTPISLFVKRYSAARVLPIMMIGFVRWSQFHCSLTSHLLSSGCNVAFRRYRKDILSYVYTTPLVCGPFIQRMIEIFAIRWFLGMFESAMLPGVVRGFLIYSVLDRSHLISYRSSTSPPSISVQS